MSRWHHSQLSSLIWGVTGLGLVLLLFFFTPRGLGMSPDSVAYLKSVQGLFQGKGLAYFSVQWPPLYPLLMSATSQLFSGDLYLGSRLANALLYGILFILIGVLFRQTIPKHKFFAYCIALLICLHPVVSRIYFYAFSETLFLCLLLLDLILLGQLSVTTKKLPLALMLALALVGTLATLTRYAGLCIIALNLVALLLKFRGQRIGILPLTLITNILPTSLFLLLWRQRMGIGDTETNLRPFAWHMISVENINQGLINLGHWLIAFTNLSDAISTMAVCWVLGASLVCLIICLSYGLTRELLCNPKLSSSPDSSQWLCFLIIVFILGYIIFLVLMRSFFDPNIILDDRTLSPILIPIFFVILFIAFRIKRSGYKLGALILILGTLLANLQSVRPLLLISYFNGIELSDKHHRSRDLVKFVRTCAKKTVIYADQPWNFNLEMESMVHWLPTQSFYGSWKPNLNYTRQVAELSKQAQLIIVEDINSAIVRDLDQMTSFRRIYTNSQGIVWENIAFYNVSCERG